MYCSGCIFFFCNWTGLGSTLMLLSFIRVTVADAALYPAHLFELCYTTIQYPIQSMYRIACVASVLRYELRILIK